MIRPISRNEILNGLGQDYYCYMFGANHHAYKCNMWQSIYDEVGGIGFLARDGKKIVGQMIFIPKKDARRIAIPMSHENSEIERTMVIGCLYVLKNYGNRGIASQMIHMLIDFCQERGYRRIEACVHPGTPQQAGTDTSFCPFRKFGFAIDESCNGFEFRPDTRICYLELKESSERSHATDTASQHC